MAKNENLKKAKKAKNDEFYTQLSDIEKELIHYKKHFKDKVVFCNCDDPYESNFFKYFAMNFNSLGLKKLISTCYINSEVAETQLSIFEENNEQLRHAYRVELDSMPDLNNDGAIDLRDVEFLLKQKQIVKKLKGDGDFRSEECIELLKEADIVVTNPPFSLFREYVAQLIEYNKKFLIIGNVNAITYKEIFPLIKDNRIWIGYKFNGAPMLFRVPKNYPIRGSVVKTDANGNTLIGVGGTCWFTNMDIDKRHEEMLLYQKYSPELYPKYDNYDAINVDKTKDIPCDYYEAMGVPITFLDKYNPEQFEILNANDIRKDKVMVRFKSHGLIKDKEASITEIAGEKIHNNERERESQNDVCKNRHQKTCLHRELTDGILMENENMQESLFKEKIFNILINNYGYKRDELSYCNGIMGMPITFMDKYNPEQFEIIGHEHDIYRNGGEGVKNGQFEINKIGKYKRTLIRRKV